MISYSESMLRFTFNTQDDTSEIHQQDVFKRFHTPSRSASIQTNLCEKIMLKNIQNLI